MSSISMHVPTLQGTTGGTKDFIDFVYAHEPLLKHYGAIKIVTPIDYKQLLKKSITKLALPLVAQQFKKFDNNNYIYSVDMVTGTEKEKRQQSLPLNETDFWLSLSHPEGKQPKSSFSMVPKMSFFLKRVHRTSFDIHRLPTQSLLKVCGTRFLQQFTSSLTRAHGPGAVFPLSSTRQRLHSFNYHHQGGFRQWYIIPASEREALQRVCQEKQTTPVCLDHGRVLIHPSILDQHKIRYYRLVQYPNEVIILAAGALSQSFTEKASWYEAIDFALPSWVNDGHAAASCISSCTCVLDDSSSQPLVDVQLFRPEVVQRYIVTNLHNVIDNECSTNEDEMDLDIGDIPPFSDISSKSTASSVGSLNQATTSAADIHFFESEDMDEYNYQAQLKTSWEDNFSEISTHYTGLTTPPQHRSSSKLIDTLYAPSSSLDFGGEMVAERNSVSRHLSFQEIMDILAIHPCTVQSTECQTEERIDEARETSDHQSITCSSTQTQDTELKNISTEKDINTIKNTRKTLYISNIRSEVSKADIRHYFVGSSHVILKQSKLAPFLKYAFVDHRTNGLAEYNRNRRINYHRFGSDCQVEYADNSSQCFGKWNVVVKNIPENVSEESIRDLFTDCNSIKYTPARVIKNMRRKDISDNENKVLSGFAFLHYVDANDAADLVKKTKTIKINDHPLTISYYNEMKTRCSQRRQANNGRHSSTYFPRSKNKNCK